MTDTAMDIVEQDLEYITGELREEFGRMGRASVYSSWEARGFSATTWCRRYCTGTAIAGKLNPIRRLRCTTTIFVEFRSGWPRWMALPISS